MSEQANTQTELVTYAGRHFRIRSEVKAGRTEVSTTLEHGEAVVMSKATPLGPARDAGAMERTVALEARSMREQLLAGKLDSWLTDVGSASKAGAPPPPPEGQSRRSRPGRWAAKVGRVESPFEQADGRAAPTGSKVGQTRAVVGQALADWDIAPASSARLAPRPEAKPKKNRSAPPKSAPVQPGSAPPKSGSAPPPKSAPVQPGSAPPRSGLNPPGLAPPKSALGPSKSEPPKIAWGPSKSAPPKIAGGPSKSAPPKIGKPEMDREAFAPAEPLGSLGPYLLLEHLDGGGYIAATQSGGAPRLVALYTRTEPVPHLAEELRALLRIEHAALVPILEVGEQAGTLFWTTPLLEGTHARMLLGRCAEMGKPLPVDVVGYIGREVARALEVLHAGLRVHGAIVLEQIVIGYRGEVRLAGLGDALGKPEKPTALGDVRRLGALLLALLGRGEGGFSAGARAPFVPPALLQVALRACGDPAVRDPSPSIQRVVASVQSYLDRDAPRTDGSRLARLVGELLPDRAQQESSRRERLLDQAHAHWIKQAENRSKPPKTATPVIDPEKPRDPELVAGTLVDGRYRVERLCGRGGMGWVYEAEHQGIGKRMALKILHPIYSRAPDVAERFRREARAASKIGHPHIIDVFDFGTTEDGCLYIAMELLEGRDLGALLEEVGSLPLERVLRIVLQICRALDAAHMAGIIHRDLKPENIFLLAHPERLDFVKVLDFGIAKHIEDGSQEKLTRPNIALGTPEYMAPEQVSGKTDPRSDVYSVGAMMFEMLVGVPPFEGEHYLEVFRRKAVEDPPAPSAYRKDLPPAIDKIVIQALARDAARRYPSMRELAQAIEELLPKPAAKTTPA